MIKALLLCAALAAPLAATEYRVELRRNLQATASQQQLFLNEMAKDGWRLVAVIRDNQLDVVFYFEREEANHEPN